MNEGRTDTTMDLFSDEQVQVRVENTEHTATIAEGAGATDGRLSAREELVDEGGLPPKPPVGDDGGEEPWPSEYVPLRRFIEKAYLSYAMSVVLARALPRTSDGLKPVQRRILHAMNAMRLGAGAKHVKSARVVGDVIGKYHPHGDSSVYDAMVRVAQDFTLRYPLVDGQGNFGSMDGDSAAAMRYTECRLTPIAELLLSELHSGTVNFESNYDGSFEEPVEMPAQLPFLLLNGASGIAVGMATEIPSHNLGEVCAAVQVLLANESAGLDEVMECVRGPDFPGGGQITSSQAEIRSAYETGRGSLQVRARWRFEEMARGEWKVVVYEMPPGVSCAKVLSEIDAITNPQVRKGKKELSQEQRNDKQLMLSVLDAARDESSKSEMVRLVLEPKSRNQNRDQFMAIMTSMTSLWSSAPVNMNAVKADGRPDTNGLLDLLNEWIAFRLDVVERRSRHRLEKVRDRLHILEGRAAVLLNIDEVIAVIRSSDEPKSALIQRFSLSEVQADDILEIRLRALARLEALKIQKETSDLRKELGELSALVDSPAALKKLVSEEVSTAAAKFADPRRTVVEEASKQQHTDEKRPVVDEPVTAFLSRGLWLHVRQGHGVDGKSIGYKEGDGPMSVFETRTSHSMCLLDDDGRAYTVPIADITSGRSGVPLTSLVKLEAGVRIIYATCGTGVEKFLFASDDGYGFIGTLNDAMGRMKAGKHYMKPADGAKVLPPVPASGEDVCVISSTGRMVVYPLSEIKELPGGKGVRLQKLDEGSTVAAFVTGKGTEAHLVMQDDRKLRVTGDDFDKCRLTRSSKGCYVARKGKVKSITLK